MLAIFVAATLFLIGVTSRRCGADLPTRLIGERATFNSIRRKSRWIHAGQSYYDAAAAELTARGYPTHSVFNWRTPLLELALGKTAGARRWAARCSRCWPESACWLPVAVWRETQTLRGSRLLTAG